MRLLQVTHGSIHQAFSTSNNHSQLDCFFALLHRNCINLTDSGEPVQGKGGNCGQSAVLLPLPTEIKIHSDKMLTEFESADFGDMVSKQ